MNCDLKHLKVSIKLYFQITVRVNVYTRTFLLINYNL